MYIPRNRSQTRTAIIEYEDSSIPEISQQVIIKTNSVEQCVSMNKVLIGISDEVMIRSIASLKGRIKKIVHKNYIIPYKNKVNEYFNSLEN